MTLHVFLPRLSSAGSATVPTAPAAPSVAVGDTQLTATWSAPSSDGGSAVTSYDLRHSVESAESWTTITGVTSPRTVTGLTNSTAYETQVRAVNAVGPSAWSASTVQTPAAASFSVRSVTNANTIAGTALAVPAGAVTGDTLIFVASRDFQYAGSVVAPSGATAVGTPVDQGDGYASFLVWRILSWDGSTNTYDFGWSAGVGERSIICLQGAASAVTAGTYTTAFGTSLAWTGLSMTAGDVAVAVAGLYNPGHLPLSSMDSGLTLRKTQSGWAGLGVYTELVGSTATFTPSPVGTAAGSANSATLMLRAAP